MGQVHKNTVPARRLLEQEGFRFENYVDIFDGGPTLEARVQDIRAVRESRLYLANIGQPKSTDQGNYYIVANTKVKDFRCILIQRPTAPNSAIVLSQDEADTLCIVNKDPVRIVELSPN